jgi:phage gp36-like protein
MPFLTKEELKTVATTQLIDKITAGDDTIVTQIIDESIALMTSYLSKYYDVAVIFAAVGVERNLNVLKKLKDICIYEIYERHTREQNLVAQRRFNEAINWLEKINAGEFYDRSLPPKPDDDASDNDTTSDDIRFGSYPRYSTNY